MLAFIGVRPGSTVLDLSAGGGYTTELLARAVGPAGHVYGQSAPRDPARAGPAAPEGANAPAAAGTVGRPAAAARCDRTAAAPAPIAADRHRPRQRGACRESPRAAHIRHGTRRTRAQAGDAEHHRGGPALRGSGPAPRSPAAPSTSPRLMFNYHDLGHLGVDRAAMNAAVFRALKPGGLYVIADHAGRPGTGISESGTLHRVEEAFVRREVEAAGFRWVASGDFLRNPQDPRDRNVPEPPQPKDEFVLKFVKPAPGS